MSDREDIIRAAMAYRAERTRMPPPHGEEPPRMNGEIRPFPTFKVSELAGLPVPEFQFIDAGQMLPQQTVVLLQGDGGTGKSLLATQLALACTTGTAWLGVEVTQGPVLYLSAEDGKAAVHKRVDDICRAEGIDMAEAHTLEVMELAGKDAALVFEHKDGRLKVTDLFKRVDVTMEYLSPQLLILDNCADVYAANENNRALVRQFVGMLAGIAIRRDCTVVLLAHPSLAGMASNTGSSGSTAWNNSVRARLWLRAVKDASGYEVDKSLRELEVMKSNYAARGDPISLRYEAGRFVRKELPKAFDKVRVHHLEQVQAMFRAGRFRTDERSPDWGGYAVANILDADVGQAVTRKEDRLPEQERERRNIRQILNKWVQTKAIRIEAGEDEHRKMKQFYRA